MASCSRCGVETELHYSGVPLCLKCSDLWEAKRKPPAAEQQVRATLLQDILALTARIEEATAEFNVVVCQVPSTLPHPDGAQRMKSASAKLAVARQELMNAHRRLDEHLDRGIVPEVLKRSG